MGLMQSTRAPQQGTAAGRGEGQRRVSLQGYLTYKKRKTLGPYRRPMFKVLGGSQGGRRFLLGEVPQ